MESPLTNYIMGKNRPQKMIISSPSYFLLQIDFKQFLSSFPFPFSSFRPSSHLFILMMSILMADGVKTDINLSHQTASKVRKNHLLTHFLCSCMKTLLLRTNRPTIMSTLKDKTRNQSQKSVKVREIGRIFSARDE